MKKKRVILWFRNDLRLHDNEALYDAVQSSIEVFPVYVIDERVFSGKTSFGFRKIGPFRARFILESVKDLKASLKAIDSDLIVRRGNPEEVIYKLAKDLKTDWIFCNRERTDEEVKIQDKLERNLWAIGQEVRYSRGKMLYYTADLPFPVTHTPETFTSFRKEVEKIVEIRSPLPIPGHIPGNLEAIETGSIPNLEDLGFSPEEKCKSENGTSKGGETEGLERMNDYFWRSGNIQSYMDARDHLSNENASTRFSPYLSQGCLSPKMIYEQLKKFEEENGANESTHQLFMELMWRDFFRLLGKKHGNEIFKKGGIKKAVPSDAKDDLPIFRIWAEGRTGVPFVDAGIRELNETGYLPNRARRNVSSYLVHEMGINWQIGAEYFESLLIDYDPCSNWVNWNFLAGVGNDPKAGRVYNTLNQARKYDPQGDYVRQWIPALKILPNEFVHEPSILSETQQISLGFVLGRDYPKSFITYEV